MRGASYDIGGTSHFAVDFSYSAYDGWLQLAGTDATGATTDFGQWTFAGDVRFGQFISADLEGPGTFSPGSTISPQFYGPTGQEIGATFSFEIGWPSDEDTIYAAGVTVAKEQ